MPGHQTYRRILGFFLLSYVVWKPNLAKASYGWLPLQLHHKIGKKEKTMYPTYEKFQENSKFA